MIPAIAVVGVTEKLEKFVDLMWENAQKICSACLMTRTLRNIVENAMVSNVTCTALMHMFFCHLEITPCLTFGCSVKGDKCECYYNNVCPLQKLPFYTREECEDTLKSENNNF